MPVMRQIPGRLLAIAGYALVIAACSEHGNVDHKSDLRAAGGPVTPQIQTSDDDVDEIVGVASADLSAAELVKNSRAALEGDGVAAVRMTIYYEMAALDRRNGEYWAQIAAENGDVIGMIHYAGYLVEVDVQDADRCRRAAFWMKRAKETATVKEDVAYATEFAKEVQEKCSNL